jgi:hypothetical protein
VVNVEKPSGARLSQAAVEIRIKRELPKATDCFADFHSCGIVHRPFSFSFLVLFSIINEFPLWENRPGRVTNSRPYWVDDLQETFERDQHGECDVCSDDVLRGLGYKDYG